MKMSEYLLKIKATVDALLLSQDARIERNKLKMLSLDSLSANLANTQLRCSNLMTISQSWRGNFKSNFTNNFRALEGMVVTIRIKAEEDKAVKIMVKIVVPIKLKWCVRFATNLDILPPIVSLGIYG